MERLRWTPSADRVEKILLPDWRNRDGCLDRRPEPVAEVRRHRADDFEGPLLCCKAMSVCGMGNGLSGWITVSLGKHRVDPVEQWTAPAIFSRLFL
jgi:hypothetical protein